jgi:C-terminal processing protease CtpA/Prc
VIGYTFKSFPVADPLVKGDNYGINLENYGVPPDVWAQNTPTDEVKRVDRELQAAIEEVMRMLKAGPGVTGGNDRQPQR